MHDIPGRLFLSSERAEERLLAVLGNLDGEEPVKVIETVLKSVAGPEPHGLEGNKYFEQLRVIVQLRNLASQYEEAMVKVASFFKVERDALYQIGEKKGIEKELERGAEQKSYEFVRNLILEFGFSDEQAARASNTSIEFVQKVRSDLARKKQ